MNMYIGITILTHGYSRVVYNMFQKAASEGKNYLLYAICTPCIRHVYPIY